MDSNSLAAIKEQRRGLQTRDSNARVARKQILLSSVDASISGDNNFMTIQTKGGAPARDVSDSFLNGGHTDRT